MTIWGSAGEEASATIAGIPVIVDVAVNDDDEIRIAAWSKDDSTTIELVFTPAEAEQLRDLLTTAVKEGRWLASMSRVSWNFGGGPVAVRPRSWSDSGVLV